MSSSNSEKVPRDPFHLLFSAALVIVVLVAFWMARKPAEAVIPVLRHHVPAYRVIGADDISSKKMPAGEIGSDVIRDAENLIEHYTREPVQSGQPVRKSQIAYIVDPRLLENTVATTIPAAKITSLSDALRAGDVVNVSTVSGDGDAQVILSGVMILDVNPPGRNQTIVLAVPENNWTNYLNKVRSSPQLLLAKRIN